MFLASGTRSLCSQLPTFCTALRTFNAGIIESFIGRQRENNGVLVFGSVSAVECQNRIHGLMRQVGLDRPCHRGGVSNLAIESRFHVTFAAPAHLPLGRRECYDALRAGTATALRRPAQFLIRLRLGNFSRASF